MIRDDIVRRLAGGGGQGLRGDEAIARALGNTPLPDTHRDGGPARPAAVLVPLIDHAKGMTVLLTRRTDHLANHAGQVSFPGGRLEDGDDGPIACALRETEEETGLPAARVDVLGRLDDYVTITGFRVVPVVGLVTPPFPLRPDPFEVAEVFEVPLAFLLDPANLQRRERIMPDGTARAFYAIPYGPHFIWGATAGMLINLARVLGPVAA